MLDICTRLYLQFHRAYINTAREYTQEERRRRCRKTRKLLRKERGVQGRYLFSKRADWGYLSRAAEQWAYTVSRAWTIPILILSDICRAIDEERYQDIPAEYVAQFIPVAFLTSE